VATIFIQEEDIVQALVALIQKEYDLMNMKIEIINFSIRLNSE
jgi:hypothetical protein